MSNPTELPDSRFLHSKEVADDEPKVDSTRLSFWRQGWNAYRNVVLARRAQPQPTLDAILNCYSPDDTVGDYQDKIRALFGETK